MAKEKDIYKETNERKYYIAINKLNGSIISETHDCPFKSANRFLHKLYMRSKIPYDKAKSFNITNIKRNPDIILYILNRPEFDVYDIYFLSGLQKIEISEVILNEYVPRLAKADRNRFQRGDKLNLL